MNSFPHYQHSSPKGTFLITDAPILTYKKHWESLVYFCIRFGYSIRWVLQHEKDMATHCSILAWRIPMDRAARPAIGLQRVGHDWATAKPYSTWKTRAKFLANQIHSLVLVTQSWLTLCDPMDCSLPGSSVVGILQERTLEWVAISPGNRPDPGIESRFPSLPADFLLSELWEVKIHSLDLDKYTMTLIYQCYTEYFHCPKYPLCST